MHVTRTKDLLISLKEKTHARIISYKNDLYLPSNQLEAMLLSWQFWHQPQRRSAVESFSKCTQWHRLSGREKNQEQNSLLMMMDRREDWHLYLGPSSSLDWRGCRSHGVAKEAPFLTSFFLILSL
ncbi:hypothetical protein TNCT_176681 [Trichonephila clavata]|uniref:Uncharacterized protein n=1 Tax=Trichonephila clavata TaxID=2740835 RepID=A0A8X6LAS3_TRICU|nr:hypothetical protein TNCT_176681 [Trichonephila clavata]